MDFVTVLNIIAIANCSLIGLLLLASPQNNKYGNYYLAAFLFLIALMLLDGLALAANFYLQYPLLSELLAPSKFLLGPTLLLYVFVKTRTLVLLKIKLWYLHLLPFMLSLINYIPYYLLDNTEKIAQMAQPELWVDWFNHFYVFYTHLMICCLAAIKEITRYREQLRNNLANTSKVKLTWLMMLCFGVVGIITTDVIIGKVAAYYGAPWSMIHIMMIMLIIFYIVLMAMFAIKQSKAINQLLVIEAKPKYQNSGLSLDRMDYYLEKLHQVNVDEKTYLNSHLSLATLADRLEITPHHLSQILNERLDKSFYDYINELRIEHAKEILLSSQKAVIDVAIDSGYNSKTSFYNSFKKQMGMTPTVWRQSQSTPVH